MGRDHPQGAVTADAGELPGAPHDLVAARPPPPECRAGDLDAVAAEAGVALRERLLRARLLAATSLCSCARLLRNLRGYPSIRYAHLRRIFRLTPFGVVNERHGRERRMQGVEGCAGCACRRRQSGRPTNEVRRFRVAKVTRTRAIAGMPPSRCR